MQHLKSILPKLVEVGQGFGKQKIFLKISPYSSPILPPRADLILKIGNTGTLRKMNFSVSGVGGSCRKWILFVR